MYSVIKGTEGVDINEVDFLSYTFDKLIKYFNIKYGEKYVNFTYPRASEVFTGYTNLYVKLAKCAEYEQTRKVLLEDFDNMKKILFGNCDFSRIIKRLLWLMNSDAEFDNQLKLKINSMSLNDKEIYVEFIIYVLKIENERNKVKKLANLKINGKNKINNAIIGNIIEKMISKKGKFSNNIKHTNAWTLEDKIKVNKLNYCLKVKIMSSFDDYENVMEVIDALSETDIMIPKYVYKYYEDVYFDVLSKIVKGNIDENKITEFSSIIFEKINDYIYNELFSNNKVLEYEAVRYNLFALTVSVFYQCKFLLKVEEEK